MRYAAPLTLGLLLLSPLLAHADGLDGALLLLEVLAAIWGLALLLMLFSLLAYRQPASYRLRVLNYAGMGLSLLLGLGGTVFLNSSDSGVVGLGAINPFLWLSLPFAAWLGGASRATYATQPRTRQWAVAVAVAGAMPAVYVLFNLATSWLLPFSLAFGLVGSGVAWVLRMLVAAGVWWVVLTQAQRRQPLGWHDLRPVLLVPALAIGLGTAYAYLPYVASLSLQTFSVGFVSFISHSLPGCAVGAATIWLNQRRY